MVALAVDLYIIPQVRFIDLSVKENTGDARWSFNIFKAKLFLLGGHFVLDKRGVPANALWFDLIDIDNGARPGRHPQDPVHTTMNGRHMSLAY